MPSAATCAASGLRMIDDVMRAERADPVLRLGTRGGRDDSQVGALARDLDGDRADAAGTADDEDGRRGAGNGLGHVQPIETGSPMR